MSNETTNTAVPKLRFPEFREAGEWEEKQIKDLFDSGNKAEKGGLFDNERIITVRLHGLGVVKNDRAAALTGGTNYFKRETGQFIFSKIDLLNGAFGLVPEKLNGFVSSADIPALTFKNQESAGFFLNWMLASYKTLALERTGTSTTLKRISKEGFLSSAIWLPSVKEQQKIAATFSSLDDLITAQNAKLAALQAHKRGLMQALFPAEGETVPKLRFSEFQDAGEWEEKKFGQLGNLVSGLTYSPKDVRENGLLVLRSSNVQNGKIALDDCVYVTPTVKGANLSKPNDILICVRNGSKALIGKNALIPDGMPLCTHGAFMTVFRSPNPAFVFQLLQSDSYNKQVSEDLGATINSINGNQLLKYIFYVPELEEQKKIAECLSALDDSITAQSQKIEALKLHKKGLMQRLFPALLEAAV
ncbi:restriction endonuclease subunit S [Hymenobacter sp. J193]|uniref:restriction endonuclease subunit S n=1 Tax=Hymenobacter sp. J193 TaxID=2898429 RepID=UPI002151EE71|nr:restriction endonuclease subunit S [Hymenobacter sp. J193]MCR5890739.1 restriction endonuclease subunit S [Hymenobacter sp. J193]